MTSGLLHAGTLVVEPTRDGGGRAAEIKDRSGVVHATSGEDGTIRDSAGAEVLRAQARPARRVRDVGIDVRDAQGQKLGEAGVDGYTIGFGRRKATLSIRDATGGEVARLEPRDKRGEELEAVVGGSTIATVSVEQVKSGLLRKSRVSTLDFVAEAPEPTRLLVLAGVVHYGAMLDHVAQLTSDD